MIFFKNYLQISHEARMHSIKSLLLKWKALWLKTDMLGTRKYTYKHEEEDNPANRT